MSIDWNRIAYCGDQLRSEDYHEVGDHNLMISGYEYYLFNHHTFKGKGCFK